MPQLISKETGQTVDVADASQAQAMFQSGQYGLVPGSTFTVENKYGQTQEVGAEGLEAALGAGHKLAIPSAPKPTPQAAPVDKEAAGQSALEDEYGGGINQIAAGVEGFSRGLTFGLYDVATIEGIRAVYGDDVAEEMRKRLQGRKEANPYTSFGAELAGGLAPAVVSGGGSVAARGGAEAVTAAREASTLGKAATAALKYSPAGLADLAAQQVEKKVGAVAAKVLLGEASENTLARLVVKGVEKGAGGAVYGALGGLGSEISEDVLGDREITGEKLAAAMGNGIVYGAGLGTLFGAGGHAMSSGAGWALEHASPGARKASEYLAGKAIKYGGLSPTKLQRSLDRLPGGEAGAMREALDKGIFKAGDTYETLAPKFQHEAEQAGEKLSTGLATLDAAGKVAKPRTDGIIEDVIGYMKREHGMHVEGRAQTINVIENHLNDLQAAFPDGQASFKDLRDFRTGLDKSIRDWAPAPGAPPNTTQDALKEMRSIIEGHLEKYIDDAGQHFQGDALKEYKAAKLTYQRMRTAANVAEDSAARAAKNQTAGVTEKLMGGLGVLHAVTTGNPLAAAGGLALSTAHHYAMSHGPAIGAVLLDKVSSIGALQRTIGNLDQRMDKSLGHFLEGKATEHEAKVFKSAAARDEAFDVTVQHVKATAANPQKSASALQKALNTTLDYAPHIAQKAMYVASRGSAFLASKVPPTPPSRSITPQFEKLKDYTPEEKDRFLRYVKAVDDPLSVIDDMARGTLTREGVETLKEVYPQLYEELQKQAIVKCADTTKPLKYDQKVQLGILLDIPTDPSLDGAFMGRIQDMYASMQGPQQDQAGGQSSFKAASKRPLDNSLSQTTSLNTKRSDR